jgi:hypothetical protein
MSFTAELFCYSVIVAAFCCKVRKNEAKEWEYLTDTVDHLNPTDIIMLKNVNQIRG